MLPYVRGGCTVLWSCHPCRKLLEVRCLSISLVKFRESRSVSTSESSAIDSDGVVDGEVLADSTSRCVPEAFHKVDLSTYGFGGWLPTDWTPFLFALPYNFMQLPWWGAITTVALVVRVALFPWALKHRIAGGRLAHVSERSVPINKKLEEAKRTNDSYKLSESSAELMRLYSEHKVTPFTAFKFPTMQGVVFLSVFWGLKSMTVQSVVGLEAGGTLWFPNLLQPDPYGILPILSGLLLLTNVRVGFVEVI